MGKHRYLANAILWATAIVASAIMGSAPWFTTVLLPVLSAVALWVTLPASTRRWQDGSTAAT